MTPREYMTRALAMSTGLLLSGLSGVRAQTETVLHTFSAQNAQGGNADGAFPNFLTQGIDGNFYGTAINGGTVGAQTGGNGVIYKMTSTGTYTPLHLFSASTFLSNGNQANSDGQYPQSLVQGPDGNFYGSASWGGTNGSGTIFKITPAGVFTTLYTFSLTDASRHNTDGAFPGRITVVQTDGYIYGGTSGGGANGTGTLFRISPTGVFTLLHTFAAFTAGTQNNVDGNGSDAPTVFGYTSPTAYDLYGACPYGGANGTGTLYHLAISGSSAAFTKIHTFAAYSTTNYDSPNPDGAQPMSPTCLYGGNMFGVSRYGGLNGYGNIYEVSTTNVVSTVHDFSSSATDGVIPNAFFLGTDWAFHGDCETGGANGNGGTLFKAWWNPSSLTNLWSFASGTNPPGGSGPGPLIEASDGNLYGATWWGGTNGSGTVFTYNAGLSTGLFPASYYPTTITAGSSAFVLSMGPGYIFPNATVTFNGTPLPAQYFPPTELAFVVPASLITTPGHPTITVQYKLPNGTVNSITDTSFTINAPAPVISSISPAIAYKGAPAFTLTVNGTGFQSNSTVNFNGTALTTTYVSATKLTAVVPASDLTAVGSENITVVTPAPGGGTSAAKVLTVNLTAVAVTILTYVRNGDGTLTATMTLKNTQYQTAPSATLSSAALNGVATTTTLPIALGSIAPGGTANAVLNFPASAGGLGVSGTLAGGGEFTGGSYTFSLVKTLP